MSAASHIASHQCPAATGPTKAVKSGPRRSVWPPIDADLLTCDVAGCRRTAGKRTSRATTLGVLHAAHRVCCRCNYGVDDKSHRMPSITSVVVRSQGRTELNAHQRRVSRRPRCALMSPRCPALATGYSRRTRGCDGPATNDVPTKEDPRRTRTPDHVLDTQHRAGGRIELRHAHDFARRPQGDTDRGPHHLRR